MVRIIVDSTADLRPGIRNRVDVVPLTIHFGKEEYVDGVDITGTAFYKKLETCKDLPTTSRQHPTPSAKCLKKPWRRGIRWCASWCPRPCPAPARAR